MKFKCKWGISFDFLNLGTLGGWGYGNDPKRHCLGRAGGEALTRVPSLELSLE